MKNAIIILLLFITIMNGCAPAGIQSTWRPVNPSPVMVNKILVAVVLPEKDSMLRKALEEQMSADINALGYYAVSSWHEFGPHGVMAAEQEQTYLRLCERGIDAVMTLSLLEEGKQDPPSLNAHSNLAYYNRIWSYRHLQLDTLSAVSEYSNRRYLEAFLFDLKTLQPVYFSTTRSFLPSSTETQFKAYAKNIFHHMVEIRTLVRRPKSKAV